MTAGGGVFERVKQAGNGTCSLPLRCRGKCGVRKMAPQPLVGPTARDRTSAGWRVNAPCGSCTGPERAFTPCCFHVSPPNDGHCHAELAKHPVPKPILPGEPQQYPNHPRKASAPAPDASQAQHDRAYHSTGKRKRAPTPQPSNSQTP